MTMIPSKETLSNYLLTVDTGITVVFEKADGTLRKMKATQFSDLIPKDSFSVNRHERTETDVFRVYDLEKNAWRSFRYGSVKEVIVN